MSPFHNNTTISFINHVYTNNSVRASTVTVLAQANVPNREIMKITGHKCEASLNSYNADSSEKQKLVFILSFLFDLFLIHSYL
ncbi:hypothetical protein KUTeg_016238 [Tegillarca granosa]|uniref:Uncharacterized protein n=1 Tax=Tegillarca granosa TaxID=220873 RepID=A0ABQ9EK99_TEGGR|nr:hypothetical protein KUTeg_016238 [Tegillarca granosa]